MKQPVRESLLIEGPAGVIECLLETPERQIAGNVAVVCHPHPQHGGTMHNKVVHTLCRAANELGYAALRFNFRGVGQSDGAYDEGRGEQADVAAVIEWARANHEGQLLLAGFSFGSIVAIEVARRQPPAQLVSIAPPVQRIDSEGWTQPECDWFIIVGDRDEIVDADRVVEFVDTLEPGPRLTVMSDADHFFHGSLVALRRILVDELRSGSAIAR